MLHASTAEPDSLASFGSEGASPQQANCMLALGLSTLQSDTQVQKLCLTSLPPVRCLKGSKRMWSAYMGDGNEERMERPGGKSAFLGFNPSFLESCWGQVQPKLTPGQRSPRTPGSPWLKIWGRPPLATQDRGPYCLSSLLCHLPFSGPSAPRPPLTVPSCLFTELNIAALGFRYDDYKAPEKWGLDSTAQRRQEMTL